MVFSCCSLLLLEQLIMRYLGADGACGTLFCSTILCSCWLLQAEHPELRGLGIDWEKAASSCWHVRDILAQHGDLDKWEAMAIAVFVPNLERLHITRLNVVDPIVAFALTRLTSLRSLVLEYVQLSCEACQVFLEREPWAELECIVWRSCSVVSFSEIGLGLNPLAWIWQHSRRLERLELTDSTFRLLDATDIDVGNLLDEEQMLLLAQQEWPRLRFLDFSNVSDYLPEFETRARALASASFPALEDLCLQRSSLTCRGGLLQLFKAHWAPLRVLDISHAPCIEGCVAKMVAAPWPNLVVLRARGLHLSAADARVLAGAGWSLQELDLLEGGIDEEQALAALAAGNWPDLRRLYVGHSGRSNELSFETAMAFPARSWTRLEELQLEGFEVHKGLLPELLGSRNSRPELKSIYIENVDGEILSGFEGVLELAVDTQKTALSLFHLADQLLAIV
jgi:hypothetical protein